MAAKPVKRKQPPKMSTPTTFWRLAGMSYMQYVNRAATCVTKTLKEPAKSSALARSDFSYNYAAWENGNMGAKTNVTTSAAAGK